MNAKTLPPERHPAALVRADQGGRFSDYDAYLFKEGAHTRLHDKLGAHLTRQGDSSGAYFSVWAPNAREVTVVADFNQWRNDADRLRAREDGSGIWEGFLPGVKHGDCYKYHIQSRFHGYQVQKSDPFAVCCETPPRTASRVWQLDYDWRDGDWMGARRGANALSAPIAIYEVHRRLSQLLPDKVVNACLEVMRKGRVIDLTDARAVAASRLAQAHKLALADAAMYAIAHEFRATFWTQDKDYNGLAGVKYIAKK